MAQSITLTASMRSNLASLKSIQSQMDTTQERLSTGKKVNSAIDNASSYYQSRALTNRAGDLDALLDSMGQGIQTIQAANEGIEAVTSFVEQLKSVAESAFALDPTNPTYADSIKSYQDQYDSILKEIDKLVADSSYQGINLLKEGKLTVTFNETRENKFVVQGDNILNEMGLTEAVDWDPTSVVTSNVKNAADVIGEDTITLPVGTDTYTIDGKKAYLINGAYYDDADGSAIDVEGKTITKGTPLAAAKADFDYKPVLAKAGSTEVWSVDGKDAIKVGADYYDITTPATATKITVVDPDSIKLKTVDTTINSYADSIDASINEITEAVDYLRSYATELGNNYSIIETRQNFTDALIDVLETGSDNLVLADMNEESANYLALQTRQQLAINSLSLASQSAQSVLSLFQ